MGIGPLLLAMKLKIYTYLKHFTVSFKVVWIAVGGIISLRSPHE